mmetsp:Transcript_7217/g.10758  ORF Transcript_7217/g.10758 Transcript_7217/m.10758 type:complete len:281 (+) Transcript_7217:11-853(+)
MKTVQFLLIALTLQCFFKHSTSFNIFQKSNKHNAAKLSMSSTNLSRRDLIKIATCVAIAGPILPKSSLAISLKNANQKLQDYGLPLLETPMSGMKPLLEIYGRDQSRETYLVTWNYPNGWITQRPSLDTNSEDGTISTGDYQKGDSAFFFVMPNNDIQKEDFVLSNKKIFENVILKSISQKGVNQIQNFKLKKVSEGAAGKNDQKYFIVDFQYDLLTGAGFTVERKGYGSVTQLGRGIQSVTAVTTSNRFKKLQPQLEEVAKTFRVYDGILVDKLKYEDQ